MASSIQIDPAGADRILRVLSFNIWGLAIISKERATRVRAIAEYLASTPYDVVCLQECWVYKDFELIRDTVRRSLPYSRFFNSGALGSGLAIFTRFPLISAKVMPFRLSGTPQQAFAGDFFVNKAAANIVVLHPILGELEIWTTHMHAGGEHAPDTRQTHRIAESWDLANAIRDAAARGRHVMVMGDFNAQPFSIPVAIMRNHAHLTDTFLETHPRADDLDPLPSSPEIAMIDNGMSCDSPLNTWSSAKNIPPKIQAQGGKRLDYIFYRGPEPRRKRRRSGIGLAGNSVEAEEVGTNIQVEEDDIPQLRCNKCELVLTDLVPGKTFSYSDHFGLFATFEITSSPKRISNPFSNTNRHSFKDDHTSTFTPALPYPQPGGTSGTFAFASHLSKSDVIRRVLDTMTAYTRNSQRAASRHIWISLGCLVVLLALTIGSAWQPRSYIQPIFTVLAAVLGAAGATFFYLGWVWGKWEAGILGEIMQEMELGIDLAERERGGEDRQ